VGTGWRVVMERRTQVAAHGGGGRRRWVQQSRPKGPQRRRPGQPSQRVEVARQCLGARLQCTEALVGPASPRGRHIARKVVRAFVAEAAEAIVGAGPPAAWTARLPGQRAIAACRQDRTGHPHLRRPPDGHCCRAACPRGPRVRPHPMRYRSHRWRTAIVWTRTPVLQ